MYVNWNVSLFIDNETFFHKIWMLMCLIQGQQKVVDKLGIFWSEGWLNISILYNNHLVDQRKNVFAYLLNSRHFPIRLDCSFSRIHYLSLEYQVELAHFSFDTCPLSLFLWFLTGFVYVPELHTRVIPLPCNTFSMTRQLNFAFSSCLVSRNT